MVLRATWYVIYAMTHPYVGCVVNIPRSELSFEYCRATDSSSIKVPFIGVVRHSLALLTAADVTVVAFTVSNPCAMRIQVLSLPTTNLDLSTRFMYLLKNRLQTAIRSPVGGQRVRKPAKVAEMCCDNEDLLYSRVEIGSLPTFSLAIKFC